MPEKHSYKTYLNWSSGKDAALALYYLLQDHRYQVARLLTCVHEGHQRITMHGIRKELLEAQVNAADIPGSIVYIPESAANKEYEKIMSQALSELQKQGFSHAAFGDIFLADLRKYRESQLQPLGIEAVFPLWGKNTRQLADTFLSLGFKAVVVCVDAQRLPRSFAGRIYNEDFLRDLPANVDPAGENGEFHSFCFEGPVFKQPIPFTRGETVYRTYQNGTSQHGFWFCDLIAGNVPI